MSSDTSNFQRPFPLVRITQSEYQNLLSIEQQYNTLCRNLINGGLESQTIELLSRQSTADSGSSCQELASPRCMSSDNSYANGSTSEDGTSPPSTHDVKFEPRVNGPARLAHPILSEIEDSSSEDSGSESSRQGHNPPAPNVSKTILPSIDRVATRTIQLGNLPQGITIADITSVIRGGLLVEIFLRSRENFVALSFLHAADAQTFYQHVQTHGLHLKGNKVEAKWNDRQYVLSGHVAHHIRFGACRNIVVQNCDPALTREEIYDDLEHIHNLIVVRVEFVGRSCFISTNSINGAIFARTCMMSRRKYKGCRIEWGTDECAQPLHMMLVRKQIRPDDASNRPQPPTKNRFELLSLDE